MRKPGLTAVVAVLSIAACGASDARLAAVGPSPVVAGERDPFPVKSTTTVATTTRTRPIPRTVTTRASRSSGVRLIPPAERRQVSSTAYCETGTMANGQRTYDGAVAMNGVPMGSLWHVLSGPYAGRTLTVADRIGHGSSFDIAMPGRCGAAVAYGRRSITVERVS